MHLTASSWNIDFSFLISLSFFLPFLLSFLLSFFFYFSFFLSPWSRAFPEKLPSSHVVKKFPALYETRKFITAFNARHLSLYWAISIQFMPSIPLPEDSSEYCPPIYAWVFYVVSFPQVSPLKPCMHLPSPPYVPHSTPLSFFTIWPPEQHVVSSTDQSAPHYVVFSTPLLHRHSLAQIFSSTPYYQTSSAYVPHQCERPSFTPIQKTGIFIVL